MMSSARVSLSFCLRVVGSAVITSRTFNDFMLASPRPFYRYPTCHARSRRWTRGHIWCTNMHRTAAVEFEWDPNKAARNLRKHGVRFAEAVAVLEDLAALNMPDEDSHEERFVAVGTDSIGRILVVIYAVRDARIRIISARKATRGERSQYERKHR